MIPLLGQGQSKIETAILSSGFYIEEFQLNYLLESNNNDKYSLSLDKFQFEFSNVYFNSWEENTTLHPKLEFIGPQVSLQNLTLSAEVYKPDWITNEKLKRIEIEKNFKIITLSLQLYQQEPYLGNIVYLHANALCDKDDPVQ